jgi:hypothetical protein
MYEDTLKSKEIIDIVAPPGTARELEAAEDGTESFPHWCFRFEQYTALDWLFLSKS